MVVDGMLYADARSSKRARRKRLSSGTAGVSEAPAASAVGSNCSGLGIAARL
jgi:hypothetical protein